MKKMQHTGPPWFTHLTMACLAVVMALAMAAIPTKELAAHPFVTADPSLVYGQTNVVQANAFAMAFNDENFIATDPPLCHVTNLGNGRFIATCPNSVLEPRAAAASAVGNVTNTTVVTAGANQTQSGVLDANVMPTNRELCRVTNLGDDRFSATCSNAVLGLQPQAFNDASPTSNAMTRGDPATAARGTATIDCNALNANATAPPEVILTNEACAAASSILIT